MTTASTATTDAGAANAFERGLAILLIASGVLGAAAALALSIEKFHLLENPLYVPACSISEAIDCSSVMRSAQASTFGFPNPFIGLAAFPAMALLGLQLLTGGQLARPLWILLQAGLTFAVVFVHYLAFQTLYEIGALCPFCIAVWLATIPAFFYVTVCNLTAITAPDGFVGRAVQVARSYHAPLVTAWLLLIAALILERFWTP